MLGSGLEPNTVVDGELFGFLFHFYFLFFAAVDSKKIEKLVQQMISAIGEDPMSLRSIDSTLEGHPTPNNPWVKVATGSLGQGLSAGNGIALANRNFTMEYETTVPMRLGLGGSSAIITAALRALCEYAFNHR